MDIFRPVDRAPRFSAIRAFVLAEIGNSSLCLADIAAQQGISTSYVRKLFAAERTTFTKYVLDVRLRNVSQMLTDPDARAHPISAIAAKCGFNDVSYFNRVFRKRYGCTPSDMRRGRMPVPAPLPMQFDPLTG